MMQPLSSLRDQRDDATPVLSTYSHLFGCLLKAKGQGNVQESSRSGSERCRIGTVKGQGRAVKCQSKVSERSRKGRERSVPRAKPPNQSSAESIEHERDGGESPSNPTGCGGGGIHREGLGLCLPDQLSVLGRRLVAGRRASSPWTHARSGCCGLPLAEPCHRGVSMEGCSRTDRQRNKALLHIAIRAMLWDGGYGKTLLLDAVGLAHQICAAPLAAGREPPCRGPRRTASAIATPVPR